MHLRRFPSFLCAILMLQAGVHPSAQLSAQTLDPKVLQRLQKQVGSGASNGNQLDQSREGDSQGMSSIEEAVDPKPELPEERELRRLQSSLALEELYRPSVIEKDYWDRIGDRGLRQFGYDLFRAAQTQAGPVTGDVADNYVLGIGDEVVVTFQGATNDSVTTRVDRAGRLIAGQLRPIQAAGRSLASVKALLQAETRRTLLGTEVFLSVGAVRAITVFVGGEVEKPGQYALTSMSDITAALGRAGGIRKSGSMRHVRVVRSGSVQSVDLYGLLGIGMPPRISLRDGDRIVVPVIGETVAVSGAVSRPGIFEIRGKASVAQLIAYAGGAVRPRGYRVAVSRISPDGSEVFVRVNEAAQNVVAGDVVQIVGGSAGGAANRVMLGGHVANPGVRSLGAVRNVRDLLGSTQDLRVDTYMPFAVIVRRNDQIGTREFVPVDLTTALAQGPSVDLRSADQFFVFSRAHIAFLNRPEIREIVLGSKNPLPMCKSLEKLHAVVQDSQSSRFNVITRGSFVVATGKGEVTTARTGGAFNMNADTDASVDQRSSRSNAQSELDQRTLQSKEQIEEAMRKGMNEWGCPLLFEEEPDLLPVIMEHALGIGGSVRAPGVYPVAAPITADAAAALGEGLLSQSNKLVLDVTRAQGSDIVMSRVELDQPDSPAMRDVLIGAGEDIRFNAQQPQFESGAVLLSGEFARPGLYTIRKGEKLSELIARAGGIASDAYPYGAVVTRRRVKEMQEEGFRRTARELNSSLLAIAARKETSGEAIGAVGQLINSLSTAESPGRIVVEADPRVLVQRPDLDTVLEAGDAIYMPKKPNFVLALGDLYNPGALQFIPGKSARDYLSEAGGASSTADDDRAFLVLPNGMAQPLKGGSAWRNGGDKVVPPGSTIIMPRDLDPLYKLDVIRDVATIFGQLATAVASIGILATR